MDNLRRRSFKHRSRRRRSWRLLLCWRNYLPGHLGSKAAFSLQQIDARCQGRDLRFQRTYLVQRLIRRMTWWVGHARTLTHL